MLAVLFLALQADMALIPAGEFLMGRSKATPDDKTKMRPIVLLDDRPVHKVTLDAFYLDKTEVTNAQYAAFVKATKHPAPYHWKEAVPPDLPVFNVGWDDARTCCEWAGKRLPTEAEWERAARGGVDDFSFPHGEDKLEAKDARFGVETGPGPVAKFPANAFGLFDMAGGVSEWTADWFEREYYSKPESAGPNPRGPAQGTHRVIRGGAWSDSAPRCTVFFRNWVRAVHKTPNLGFRCARSAK
ncbi:MAG: formylglycine-generating enzyme family protein [Acidobacteria bacterium]|nr:formylglycine-generating enzyme family protein [Acidobacteriota bacterium]